VQFQDHIPVLHLIELELHDFWRIVFFFLSSEVGCQHTKWSLVPFNQGSTFGWMPALLGAAWWRLVGLADDWPL